jgi:hypothetical protein
MNYPETAPKDGTVILAHFGYPQLVTAIFNSEAGKWVVALPQTGMVDAVWNDNYFESEYEHPAEMRYWIPLPTIQYNTNAN